MNTARQKLDIKHYTKRFALNWLVVLLVFVIGTSLAFGFDPISNDIDFFGGVGMLGNLFGGLASFGALLGVLVLVGAIGFGLFYMTRKDYTGKPGLQTTHIALGFVVIIAAACIGISWISLPSGAGLVALLLLAFISGATVLVTSRKMKTVPVNTTRVHTLSEL